MKINSYEFLALTGPYHQKISFTFSMLDKEIHCQATDGIWVQCSHFTGFWSHI